EFLAPGEVPQADDMVHPAGGQEFTASRDGQALGTAELVQVAQRRQLVPGGGVPDADPTLLPGRANQPLTVRGEGERMDRRGRLLERPQPPTRGDIRQDRRPAEAAGGEGLAVRRERRNGAWVSGQGRPLAARAQVPDAGADF